MSDTPPDDLSPDDQARLQASRLAEADSLEQESIEHAEHLEESGVPRTHGDDVDGLPSEENAALDDQLLRDARTPPPETDAGALADDEGWSAATDG